GPRRAGAGSAAVSGGSLAAQLDETEAHALFQERLVIGRALFRHAFEAPLGKDHDRGTFAALVGPGRQQQDVGAQAVAAPADFRAGPGAYLITGRARRWLHLAQ